MRNGKTTRHCRTESNVRRLAVARFRCFGENMAHYNRIMHEKEKENVIFETSMMIIHSHVKKIYRSRRMQVLKKTEQALTLTRRCGHRWCWCPLADSSANSSSTASVRNGCGCVCTTPHNVARCTCSCDGRACVATQRPTRENTTGKRVCSTLTD